MNERPPSDLVRQLRLSLAEEAFLWELGRQTTDYYGNGQVVAHGPWPAADCRQVLARWFDCGLIDCYVIAWSTTRSGEVVRYEYDADWRVRATEVGQFLVLAREDAGALLNDPSRWRADGSEAGVTVRASDQADGLSFDAWFGKLAGLPDHLIYERPQDGVSDDSTLKTWSEPETVRTARLWTDAIEHAVTDGLPLRCPINHDAELVFDWEPTSSETAGSRDIGDVFFFVDQGQTGPGPSFPFGRHRMWCPGCGAEQHIVVERMPGSAARR